MSIQRYGKIHEGIIYRMTVKTARNGRKSFAFEVKINGRWGEIPTGPNALRRLMTRLFAEQMNQPERRSRRGPTENPDTPSYTFDIQKAADLLQALANPHRYDIVTLLRNREMDVNSICEAIGLAQSATSQHLRLLRTHKIVTTRRDAQTIFYRLAGPEALLLIDRLTPLIGPAASKPIVKVG